MANTTSYLVGVIHTRYKICKVSLFRMIFIGRQVLGLYV